MATPIRLIVAVAVAMAISLPDYSFAVDDQTYDPEASMDSLDSSKRNERCASVGGKCFNSRQCCDGFICAVLDGFYQPFGNKPEEPGYCVKSKDLQTCSMVVSGPGTDCPTRHRCMALGRMGQKYCLPIGSGDAGVQMPDYRSIKQTDRRRYHGPGASKAIGKLGSSCVTDLDCIPRSDDGSQRMCCQLVNQGRQGTKRMCDRVTPMSACTSP